MGKRGGKPSGTITRGSSWRSGKTTVIRVPKKLAPQVIKIARMLDVGIHPGDELCQEFLRVKEKQYKRARLHFNQISPRWAVFNEFRRWLRVELLK